MSMIHKYALPPGPGSFRVDLPKGAVILCVQTQGDMPFLWAQFTEGVPPTIYDSRTIHVFGTGRAIRDDVNLRYIGTYQQMGGAFVLHCFDELP